MSKPIQEQFGQRVIETFTEFARADLETPDHLEVHEFAHVTDPALRHALAQVFYGARWIYKLGLALLVRDDERAAHVRAQIVDFATVAEGLMSDCLAHAIRKGHTKGSDWNWHDPDKKKQPIMWNAAKPEPTLARQNLWWLIRIAHSFAVTSKALNEELDWLRVQRNSVHLRERSAIGKAAFLNQSRRAFMAAAETIQQTKTWKATHP